jgi:SAM-dependent methyltransferase
VGAPTCNDDFSRNLDRFTGFAELYDRVRAAPPAVLAAVAAQYSGAARPALVVDLGSGTGLSTRYWGGHAERVIGIEPTADMRRRAEAATTAKTVSYREGFSHRTGLAERSADVVGVMQALHWMEPAATFAEAARVLRPGGVLIACDYDWPPATGAWEAEAAFAACIATSHQLERERGTGAGLKQWEKEGHLARMRASGSFRYVRELLIHHEDMGDADRLVGLLLSQGHVMGLLKRGATEAEIGIDALRASAARTLGGPPRRWRWSARVRLGVV